MSKNFEMKKLYIFNFHNFFWEFQKFLTLYSFLGTGPALRDAQRVKGCIGRMGMFINVTVLDGWSNHFNKDLSILKTTMMRPPRYLSLTVQVTKFHLK